MSPRNLSHKKLIFIGKNIFSGHKIHVVIRKKMRGIRKTTLKNVKIVLRKLFLIKIDF